MRKESDVTVGTPMNIALMKTGVRVWLMEILVSGFNFFVLMNHVYEPRWGVLVAHQVGMATRIVYICVFAYLLLRYVKRYDAKDLVHVGILWLGLTLAFEWLGSLALGRPVEEILVGWNIFAGYVWPYVLLTYLLSNLASAQSCTLVGEGAEAGNGEVASM